MELIEVEAFVAITELGAFTQAALTLHISQPAISRRIDLLERELGAPLFERVRGARPTEAGRAFLPHARHLLAAARDGAAAVRALEQEESGTVALALVGTLASTEMTTQLRRFRADYPRVRLLLRTARSDEVSALVQRGEATLGLRYFADPDPAVVSHLVRDEALVVVCAAQSRLAEHPAPDLRALAGIPWVTFQSGSTGEPYARIVERQLRGAGLADAEVIPIDSLTAQKRLIEADFGLGLLPASSIGEEVRLGALRALEVPALRATLPVMAIYRRRAYLSRAARRLLADLGDPSPWSEARDAPATPSLS